MARVNSPACISACTTSVEFWNAKKIPEDMAARGTT
jgi:hypothetical protein